MARPSRPPTDYLVPLAPRFAAAFSLVGMRMPGFSGLPMPTAKDVALALAMLAPYLRRPFTFFPASGPEVEALALFGELREGKRHIKLESAVHDLLRMSRVDRHLHLDAAIGRVSRCAMADHQLIDRDHGYELDREVFAAAFNGIVVATAHPASDRRSDPVMVDTRLLASFACRHSPPVYLRALAWHDRGLRPAVDSVSLKRRPDGAIVAEMPAIDAVVALGIDLTERHTSGDVGRIFAAVKRDLAARTPFGVGFEWIDVPSRGKPRHDRLRLTITKAADGVAAPARTVRKAKAIARAPLPLFGERPIPEFEPVDPPVAATPARRPNDVDRSKFVLPALEEDDDSEEF